MDGSDTPKDILLLEAFYGGSHKQLIDILYEHLEQRCAKICMSDKKWHWRMRTSSLHFATVIPRKHNFRFLFVSSVINLAELVGLRPDLADVKKILYFHENQLVYPVRKQQDRDFQYGYNQIVSCLTADSIIFNSKFNQDSYLSSIKKFLSLMPDYKPTSEITELIRPKCRVLYFPINLKPLNSLETQQQRQEKNGPLHIVWAHRWEHDKDPTTFFETLFALKNEEKDFIVSVLGQGFTDVPEIFEKAKMELSGHIVNWGFQEAKEDFISVLRTADVAVSTAIHEFFGVSMLEAVCCACYPLCPNRLVYPEIFPAEYLYNIKNQLLKRLRKFCERPSLSREHILKVDPYRYDWEYLHEDYKNLFSSCLDVARTHMLSS